MFQTGYGYGVVSDPGVYIMQNTMVRGGGEKWPAGEKK